MYYTGVMDQYVNFKHVGCYKNIGKEYKESHSYLLKCAKNCMSQGRKNHFVMLSLI